jgi:hypothetical protein
VGKGVKMPNKVPPQVDEIPDVKMENLLDDIVLSIRERLNAVSTEVSVDVYVDSESFALLKATFPAMHEEKYALSPRDNDPIIRFSIERGSIAKSIMFHLSEKDYNELNG